MLEQLHKIRPLSLTLALVAALCGGCKKAEKKIEQAGELPAEKPRAAESLEPETPDTTVTYREVRWEELIPKEDLDALLNPPDYLDGIAEGSEYDVFPEDAATNATTNATDPAEIRYQQALTSAKIKPEFDRQQVRIPGFVVPLEFDDEQTITSFLLVPYFGACMHLPPPPPNQVIYAEFTDGFQVEFLYDAVYIEGELRTAPEDTERGTAAYTMNVKRVSPYEE